MAWDTRRGHSIGDHLASRRLGAKGCLIIALIVVGSTVGFLTLAIVTWNTAARRRLERELAAIRARGEPTTVQELEDAYRAPPADRDVTELIVSAWRRLNTEQYRTAASPLPIVGSGTTPIPDPGQAWSELPAARKLVRDFADVTRQLQRAAEQGGAARFPTDFSQGMAILLPHVNDLRTAARHLYLNAHVAAHDGDAREVARSIQAMLGLSHSLDHEPLLVSQLVRYSLIGMATESLETFLATVPMEDADLERLQSALREVDTRDGLRSGLLGERAMSVLVLRDAGEHFGEVPGIRVTHIFGASDAEAAFALQYYRKYLDAINLTWPEALTAAESVAGGQQSLSGIQRWRHAIALQVLPAIWASFQAAARSEAQLRIAAALIGVQRFRQQRGRLPNQLTELLPDFLPELPLDPMDGQPLRYRVTGGTVVIYSVGVDRVDNGGTQARPQAAFPDIVMRLRVSGPTASQ